MLTWQPLNRYIIQIDTAGRTVLLLSLFVLFLNFHRRSFLKLISAKPFIFWGIWVLYAFVHTVISGYVNDAPYWSFFTLLLAPLVVLIVTNYEYQIDHKALLRVLLVSLFFALIIILLFDRERTGFQRFGDVINSNRIGLTAYVFLAILILTLYKLYNGPFAKAIIFSLCVIPILMVFMTASRTAFVMISLLLIGQIPINRTGNALKAFSLFIIELGIIISTYDYVINETEIGSRMKSITLQSEMQNLNTGTFLDNFGDRGAYYVIGTEVFLDHPVWGIGLLNFIKYHGEYVMHPELMIHPTELGIIGLLLFVLFHGWIIKTMFKSNRHGLAIPKKLKEYIIIAYFGLMIYLTTGWFYNYPVPFALLGVIISELYYNNIRNIQIDGFRK